jgi:hypothetical protein
MPQCNSGYQRLERPFIYAVSISPDDRWNIFNEDETVVKLTAHITKGNFNIFSKDNTYCKVPKTGIYAIFLQVNVQKISTVFPSIHDIGVGKVFDTSRGVEQIDVAKTYVPPMFVGSAFCANLTTLEEGDLLFVKIDDHVDVAFGEKAIPIQLVAYMVSPKAK